MSAKHPIPYVDLPPNKKASLIEVARFSINFGTPLHIHGNIPHRHNYQTIVWTVSGQGKHIIDGQQIITPAHTLCLIARGQVHHFAEMSDDFIGYRALFADDFLADDTLSDT